MPLSNTISIRSAVAALGFIASCGAHAIAVGTYNLHNHPNGSVSPPEYGLRLDGLLTNSSSEEYTFDFDHALSDMTLTYTGSSIIIDGVAYGGEDIGSGYKVGTTALWTIHFEYLVGVNQPGGDGGADDVLVNADGSNFGTLSSSLGSFELADVAAGGISFHFGDESGGGHRGFDGISGWGWLMHGTDCANGTDCVSIKDSDWLFTATPVPVPAAAWLFGSALLVLIGGNRAGKKR